MGYRKIRLLMAAWLASVLLLGPGLRASHAQQFGPRPVAYAREAPAATDRSPDRTGVETILFRDGFEEGMGAWSISDISDVPGVHVQWGDSDCWAGLGSRSAACAAGGVRAISCGEEYPADMKTWMVHGPFDLSTPMLAWAELEFLLRLSSEPEFDQFFVGVSTDGVEFQGEFRSGVAEELIAFDLSDLLGQEQAWIGFQFVSDPTSSRIAGVAIDDVVVRTSIPVVPGQYGWTISSSSSDPRVNVGDPAVVTVPESLFLWYDCRGTGVEGLTSARFDVDFPSGFVAGFTPMNGFLNAGGQTTLLLASAGCVEPPLVVGVWSVLDFTGEGIVACPAPSAAGDNASADCRTSSLMWPNEFVGYNGTGSSSTPCNSGSICGETVVSISRSSWGSLKALYR